ncbi:hypothetical protein [Roseibium aggregatum]|uniref:Uncharacterized protein n=1 Tax=Roseibium aggregatum TaxID=187304 RepID=A0A0M6YCW9_9HYPH|nr:hypothetical protein [Roseibium aggregatum]CTQ47269.1 hypothetical protein LAL4801_05731 [Roseibium aggregatum]
MQSSIITPNSTNIGSGSAVSKGFSGLMVGTASRIGVFAYISSVLEFQASDTSSEWTWLKFSAAHNQTDEMFQEFRALLSDIRTYTEQPYWHDTVFTYVEELCEQCLQGCPTSIAMFDFIRERAAEERLELNDLSDVSTMATSGDFNVAGLRELIAGLEPEFQKYAEVLTVYLDR